MVESTPLRSCWAKASGKPAMRSARAASPGTAPRWYALSTRAPKFRNTAFAPRLHTSVDSVSSPDSCICATSAAASVTVRASRAPSKTTNPSRTKRSAPPGSFATASSAHTLRHREGSTPSLSGWFFRNSRTHRFLVFLKFTSHSLLCRSCPTSASLASLSCRSSSGLSTPSLRISARITSASLATRSASTALLVTSAARRSSIATNCGWRPPGETPRPMGTRPSRTCSSLDSRATTPSPANTAASASAFIFATPAGLGGYPCRAKTGSCRGLTRPFSATR
mmetsp:Transcript_71335/g.212772  ORF Transcript_71335/g.212772 Transcript_71335/m.212772 type:complete len:281 (+) Transcript_71335:329-1171(+)